MSQAVQRGEYPTEWKAISTNLKMEARWRCVRCNHPHDFHTGHVLTVHHFDGNRSNNERWNLMVLCQRCHLSVQARVDPEHPLMFDPALWSMPYIAGLYESGHGVPGPTYNLEVWIEQYERVIGVWPQWAPRAEAQVAGTTQGTKR